jgi:hypothetical protein
MVSQHLQFMPKCRKIGACMKKQNESENGNVSAALKIFFAFVDSRRSLAEAFPPSVRQAFNVIIAYYTPRLRSALALTPYDRLYSSECLYNYSWIQLWKHGQKITQNRTPGGVFMWLKSTFQRRQMEILKYYALERRLRLCLDTLLQDNGRIDHEVRSLVGSPVQTSEVAEERLCLLHEYYQTALARLNPRQQQIIKLSKLHAQFQDYLDDESASHEQRADENGEESSLAEIKERMGFSSIDAVKGFKRRAFQALVKELVQLFQRDLDQTNGDLFRREILDDWRERIVRSGTRLMKCRMSSKKGVLPQHDYDEAMT